MNKKALTEADIRSKFITPALLGGNGDKWNLHTQIREEVYFTRGRVIVRGKVVRRGEAKKADYILSYKPNLPLAVIEAKDNTHSVGAGMQQALEYAEALDLPFAYSSNGDAFLEHDRTATSGTVTREIPLDQFPTPAELWARYRAAKGYTAQQEAVTTQDYYDDGTRRTPRYYQRVAINRTVDAIARGEDRILLVMATGTGKTYTAFQIIWRLWKSGARKRILFLVDRNILADQTKTNDFKPFGAAMTTVRQAYASLDDFLNVWNDAVRKQTILDELARKGVFLDELAAQVGRDYDAFDLLCHVAFDARPLTRRERAERVQKRNVFGTYGEKARAVLNTLLWKYADSGIGSMESMDILNVDPLRQLGTPVEIVSWFGGKPAYLAAIHTLQDALYQQAH